MVLRDIIPLMMPSAEVLHAFGAAHLKHLTEDVNASWYKCIPLVKGPTPQPDYFVGFKDSALGFTHPRSSSPENSRLSFILGIIVLRLRVNHPPVSVRMHGGNSGVSFERLSRHMIHFIFR
jgi:hypothetical protein